MQAPSGSPSMHFLAHPLPCSCPSSSHLSAVSLPIFFFHLLPFSFFLFVPTPSPPPHLVSLSSSACFSCLSTVKIGVPHIGSSVCPTSVHRCAPQRCGGVPHSDSHLHQAVFLPHLGNLSRFCFHVGKLSHAGWVFVTRGLGICHTCCSCLGFCHVSAASDWEIVTHTLGFCHALVGSLSRI